MKSKINELSFLFFFFPRSQISNQTELSQQPAALSVVTGGQPGIEVFPVDHSLTVKVKSPGC